MRWVTTSPAAIMASTRLCLISFRRLRCFWQARSEPSLKFDRQFLPVEHCLILAWPDLLRVSLWLCQSQSLVFGPWVNRFHKVRESFSMILCSSDSWHGYSESGSIPTHQ